MFSERFKTVDIMCILNRYGLFRKMSFLMFKRNHWNIFATPPFDVIQSTT